MRVYVAGRFASDTIARVREVQAQLLAAGHVITFDWTHDQLPTTAQQAINDLHGVLTADVFVLVAEQDVPYCGSVAEFGMAVALGIPIYVLGTALDERLIFLKLPTIRRADAFQTDLIANHLEAFHGR